MQYVSTSSTKPQTWSSPVTAQHAAAWYLAFASVAATIDLLTKHLAVKTLTEDGFDLGSRLALMLVFNSGGAGGGMSWGAHTWIINVVVTALAICLITAIVIQLAQVDGRAAASLGLVSGGAVGNLASMLGNANGVPDFIAIRLSDHVIVCNVADLALWTGAVLLVPVVLNLIRAIRSQRARRPARLSPAPAQF